MQNYDERTQAHRLRYLERHHHHTESLIGLIQLWLIADVHPGHISSRINQHLDEFRDNVMEPYLIDLGWSSEEIAFVLRKDRV